MRLNLKVPFAEKDQAKKLGARWDARRKLWYVEGKEDVSAFARWSPTPHDASASEAPAPPRTAAGRNESSSAVHTGAQYVEQPRVCDCPPWEVCSKCRAIAFPERA